MSLFGCLFVLMCLFIYVVVCFAWFALSCADLLRVVLCCVVLRCFACLFVWFVLCMCLFACLLC